MASAIDQSLRLRLCSGFAFAPAFGRAEGRFAAVLDPGLKPRSTLEATATTNADPNGMTDKKCNGKGDSYGKGDGHHNVVAGLDAVFEDALGCQ